MTLGHRVRRDPFAERAGPDRVWSLAGQRYVRSAAGARRYGVPIGSPIPIGKANRAKPGGPRTVRTEAGVARYGVPIGTAIPLGRKNKNKAAAPEAAAPQPAPAVAPAAPAVPDESQTDTRPTAAAEQQIRDVYDQLAPQRGDWVGLADVRDELGGLPRAEQDAALQELAVQPGVHVQAESNKKALSPRDREAAVRFGGDDRHMLMIEPERTDDDFD